MSLRRWYTTKSVSIKNRLDQSYFKNRKHTISIFIITIRTTSKPKTTTPHTYSNEIKCIYAISGFTTRRRRLLLPHIQNYGNQPLWLHKARGWLLLFDVVQQPWFTSYQLPSGVDIQRNAGGHPNNHESRMWSSFHSRG